MKNIFFLLLLYSSLNSIGQPIIRYCPIDTNNNFGLVIHVLVLKDSIKVHSGISSLDNISQPWDANFCVLHPFRYDKTTDNYKVNSFKNRIDPQDYDLTLSVDKVRVLEIDISANVDTIIDISTLKILEDINLSSFECITIKTNSMYNFFVELNLDKWPNYNAFIRSNNLQELKIFGYINDKNFEQQIKPFGQLKTLICSNYLSFCDMEHSLLERITTAYADCFFIHHLVQLPLVDYYSIASTSVGLDVNSYTSRAFFIDNLSIKMINHPLHELDSVIRKYLSLNDVISGGVVLTMSDLYPGRTWEWRGDTLIASGEVKNGVPQGVWTYKLFYSKPENYYFDYSKKESIEFPENGYWTWKYPNSVLAIEGHFKKGAKEGIWKFYDPNGNLTNIKQFKKDRPKGLFTDYVTHLEGGIVEVRTFFSEYNYLKSELYDGKIDFTAGQYIPTNEPHYYIDNSNGNLLIMKNGQVIREFVKGTDKYNSLITNQFVKKLYPEFKGQLPS